MSTYRHGSHSVFSIHLHVVWITKYRKPVLVGGIALQTRDLIREICRAESVEIIKGHISKDLIHLFVPILPQAAISRLVQRLKRKNSHKLLHTFETLRRQYWSCHLWARGYFYCSSGNVTDEPIKQYIEQQNQSDDNFKVEDEG